MITNMVHFTMDEQWAIRWDKGQLWLLVISAGASKSKKTVTAEGKKCVSHQILHLPLIRKNSKLLGLMEITNNILLIVFLMK